MPEYIRISQPSLVYSKKQILQSQLESLKVLQRMDSYRKLRGGELTLKITLKKKLDETKAEISAFAKLMPGVSSAQEEEFEFTPEQTVKRQSLETEIEIIKTKLSMLNG